MTATARDGYSVTTLYSNPDDAWYLELCHSGRILVTAIVPDEDPEREPTVCWNERAGHHEVPYEVMRRFMEQVAEEIRTNRWWMKLRPGLVEIIRQLYAVFGGVVHEEEYPALLVVLRELVGEEELAQVLEGAFGAGLDPHPPAPPAARVAALRERLAEEGWTLPGGPEGSGTTYE
ncbi:hypothetical protein ACF068_00105 [Streptomyces sp. NPDC016309]|uniref:hypothetical protein n=1 Tax=Streptomyces sp. NPDC016309 TaxID=3364965 RepID=UPI0036FCB261